MSIWNSYARLQGFSRGARGITEDEKIDGALNRELAMLGRNTPRLGGVDTALENEARKLRIRRRLLRALPQPLAVVDPRSEIEARSELRMRLARLKPIEAHILVCFALGEKLPALAKDESLPLGTVKSHLTRGRQKFVR
ncbi:hypothetical protein [Methylobacterium oryzihabitans]|uniref:RNA polymerase sigma factor 70 region 4 type 2 domain-containing protein n=1 Tax=Methylobacterium oryzihabitans TaxID=2499852 RepID=A0A437P8B2_9HYPH|nr:hypothetical protein [Methylobacterium oryzihabitans]RVU18497.1 hypothetical protein EOE48_11495 [Methylobacterium oryzihabitans]